ncbi:MAG: UDP-N-acetylmuramoyl-tripeptide--D-alanyl-D-alanine ligase [bacterium]|nr:UDP-N-acetylmuramoyl-tripeptide--D-alanyl-D-alanine ligase [bacterium]
MNTPSIGWLCDTLNADAPEVSLATPLNPISIDTRTLVPGDTFWALKSNRDGHDFVPEAFRHGAQAAIVDAAWKRSAAVASFRDRLIGIADATAALAVAAKAWRETCSFPILGITGSNGKTSTKELILRLLSVRFRTGGTRGNLNNHLGVPLTLLALSRDLDAAVVEMGASFPGEIGMLCDWCRPTLGLVTSISGAHLEGFGTLETVAETKGQLYDFVAESGTAFVPTDDALCVHESSDCRKKIGYGFQPPPSHWMGTHYRGGPPTFDSMGRGEFVFQDQSIVVATPGRAAALTALAGLTAACEWGIPTGDAARIISEPSSTRGRLTVVKAGSIVILDDSYNANPASMKAALDTLTLVQAQRRVAILGDMCELGASAEDEHRRLGDDVARAGIREAIFIGDLSRIAANQASAAGVSTQWFRDAGGCETALPKLIFAGDAVLIKASRALALERIVETLKQVFA